MKKLILLISIILIAISSKGQALTGFASIANCLPNTVTAEWLGSTAGLSGGFPTNVEVVSNYTTVVLNKGKENCNHQWAVKSRELPTTAYAVYHGPAGSPSSWQNDLRICTECLRHEHIIETRTTIDKADKYQEALNRLKNK